jgi:hypothetical protein
MLWGTADCQRNSSMMAKLRNGLAGLGATPWLLRRAADTPGQVRKLPKHLSATAARIRSSRRSGAARLLCGMAALYVLGLQ